MKSATTLSSSSSSFSSSSLFLLPRRCSCSSSPLCHKLSVTAKSKNNKSPQPQSPTGSEPTPPPPRITSNVRQNLQLLKLWKEFQKRKTSAPKVSTKYRRKKVIKDDVPDDPELYRDPTSTLYYTNQGFENAVPVLLVDGYNVCGYWPKLKKHFVNGRLDVARQKLIDELVTFSLLRGDSCADAWIEKEVAALRENGCPKVWVVTSDHVQQHAAHGAHGAGSEMLVGFMLSAPYIVEHIASVTTWTQHFQTGSTRSPLSYVQLLCQDNQSLRNGAFIWSSKALISEIKASQKEVERMLEEHRSTSFQGRLLKHNLESEVVDALKDLRTKLSDTQAKKLI